MSVSALRHLSMPSRFLSCLLFVALTSSTLFAAAKLGGGLNEKLATISSAELVDVVITFQGDTVNANEVSALKSLGITRGLTMQSLPIMGAVVTKAQIQSIAAMPNVRSIWLNKQLKYFNYETTALTGVQKLRTDATMIARNKGLPYSGKGITVVVNDSGIDATHEDLKLGNHVIQNVLGTTNLHALDDVLPITYIEGVPNTDIGGGHGTHVAGTVGGSGARSGGKYAGLAPGASIVGYGSGAAIFVLDGVGGFDYAVTNQARYGVRIITNSFGTSDPTFDPDDPLQVASYNAYKHGIVVVFAAGNDGPGADTLNPYAKAPWVIGVAASDKQGHLTDFSSRGLLGDGGTFTMNGETFNFKNEPSITAPGRFIVSVRGTGSVDSFIAGDAGPQVDQEMVEPAFLPFYTVLTGTSQATPHVAGVAALILEANPSLGPLQVKQIMQQTATNIAGKASWEVGAGMINAYAAVDRAYRSANYGGTVNATRAFNSNVKLTINKSTFSIDYNPITTLSTNANSYTFQVNQGTTQIMAKAQAHGIVNDVQDTGNPLDMFLVAPDGTEYESQVPVAFPIYTDRSVVVDSPAAGTWTVVLKALASQNGIDVSTVPETVSGVLYQTQAGSMTGLGDIGSSPAAASIQAAVAQRLADGKGNGFQPNAYLTRIDLANYLTMGNEVRQYLPVSGGATYIDVPSSQALFAESTTVKGAALRDMFFQTRGVILPAGTKLFNPNGNVRRCELAYSLVQSLGQEAQALQQSGQQVTVVYQGVRIPVDDAAQIPAGFSGYVQLALDLNIINAYFTLQQGPLDLQPTVHATFKPSQNVTRAEYAVSATRFLAAF